MGEVEDIPLFFTLISVLALLSNYDRENCLINVGTEGILRTRMFLVTSNIDTVRSGPSRYLYFAVTRDRGTTPAGTVVTTTPVPGLVSMTPPFWSSSACTLRGWAMDADDSAVIQRKRSETTAECCKVALLPVLELYTVMAHGNQNGLSAWLVHIVSCQPLSTPLGF